MSPSSDALVDYCFHDPDVIELVRKQWRASSVLWLRDDFGNALPLLDIPRRTRRHLVSPYEGGVQLSGKNASGRRINRVLTPLVERLLAEVEHERNLLLEVRVPLDLPEGSGYGILEPFLRARFTVVISRWERVVDLALPEDELLRRTARRARYEIRRGINEKLLVHFYYRETVPETVLHEFWKAAVHTREEGSSRLKHEPALYTRDRSALVRDGKAALAVCERDGQWSFLLTLVSRKLGYYWDGAWAGDKSAFANYYLQYRTMLFLKELGVCRYSLGYVFPDVLAPASKAASIAFFKEGFGDELRPVYTMTLAREVWGVGMARRLARGPLGRALRRLPGLGGG